MRPKIVILTLVAAFAVLGLVAVLKGVVGKNPPGHDAAPVADATPPATTGNAANPVDSSTTAGKTVQLSEALRAEVVEKEVDRIREILSQADETNNPIIIASLLDKMSNPEPEVRQAARDALRQLNDTNAVPGLQKAADAIKDPHEKVAVLDLIDYIQTPSVTQNATPEDVSNAMAAANFSTNNLNVNYNPNFLRGAKLDKSKRRGRQPVVAPDAPATQPQ